MGTPCTDYSSAKNGDPSEASRALTAFTCRVIKAARRAGVFYVLESPRKSRLWQVPALVRALGNAATADYD